MQVRVPDRQDARPDPAAAHPRVREPPPHHLLPPPLLHQARRQGGAPRGRYGQHGSSNIII